MMRIANLGLLLIGALGLTACQAKWTDSDLDGDGFTQADGDCGEGDASVNPGATEVWYNGVDENCDGNDADKDGDGYLPAAYMAEYPSWRLLHVNAAEDQLSGDCWDDVDDAQVQGWYIGDGAAPDPATVNPMGTEAWYNGIDEDCDGNDGDQDGDGYVSQDFNDGSTPYHSEWEDINPGLQAGDCWDDAADTSVPDGWVDTFTGEASAPTVTDVNPGGTDLWYDGVDENCDFADDFDQDGDTFLYPEEDCNDEDPLIFFDDSVEEIWGNCIDENCDGNAGDQDGDGYVHADFVALCPSGTEGGWDTHNAHLGDGDCWDDPSDNSFVADWSNTYTGESSAPAAADVSPDGEDLWYDGVDEDCAGDDDFDQDVDGYSHPNDDCDDSDSAVNPGAFEDCGTAADDNCDGSNNDPAAIDCSNFYIDADGDSFGATAGQCLCEATNTYSSAFNTDCDDTSNAAADTFPGAAPNDGAQCMKDVDGDDYGDSSPSVNTVTAGSDCDDGRALVNTSINENCSTGYDDNCDGSTNAVDADNCTDYFRDDDTDGYGTTDTQCTCVGTGAFTSLTDDDCNDADADISPGEREECDANDVDEDCDGVVEDADSNLILSSRTFHYRDADGDTFGDATDSERRCDPGNGYIADDTDCNDSDAAINPAATEICDSGDVDEDCDGQSDDDDSSVSSSSYGTFYRDSDSDGYGNANNTNGQCDPGGGYIVDNTDCNDSASGVNPGATEVCDNSDVDEDCDGQSDDADSSVQANTRSAFYLDGDGDGYGHLTTSTQRCDAGGGYIADNTDCNDSLAAINPGAQEVCDASDTDEDCDGQAEDSDSSAQASTKTTHYRDADGDSYGNPNNTSQRCDPNSNWLTDNTDCNDSASAINPAAQEVCDNSDVDEDCDGNSDDDDGSATGQTAFYLDGDSDGFGHLTTSTQRCDAGGGYLADNTDCDDGDPAINPSASETWYDGVDQDCDPSTEYDADGDGEDSDAHSGADCDDTDAGILPGAEDVCFDGVDDDCDDITDEGTTTPCYSAEDDSLVITELMYDPSFSPDYEGEWFEIYNNAGSTVHLGGLEFIRENSSADESFYVPTGTSIAAGARMVFCFDSTVFTDGDDTNATYLNACDYVYGSDVNASSPLGATFNANFKLTNSNLTTITIEVGGETDSEWAAIAIDSVDYLTNGGWPTQTAGYSIEFSEAALAGATPSGGGSSNVGNNKNSNWCLAVDADSGDEYFDDGGSVVEYGTPGVANNCP